MALGLEVRQTDLKPPAVEEPPEGLRTEEW